MAVSHGGAHMIPTHPDWPAALDEWQFHLRRFDRARNTADRVRIRNRYLAPIARMFPRQLTLPHLETRI